MYYNNIPGGYPNGYPPTYQPQYMNYTSGITSSDYEAFYASHNMYEAMGIADQVNAYKTQLDQIAQQPGYYVPPQNVNAQNPYSGISTYPFKPYEDTIDKQPTIPFKPTLVKLDEKHEEIKKKVSKSYYEMNDDERSEMIDCCSRYKRRHGLPSDAFVDYAKALEEEIDFVKGVVFEKEEEKKEEPKPEPVAQPQQIQPQYQQQPLPTNPVFQQQMYGYNPQPQPIMQQQFPTNPVFQQQMYGYTPQHQPIMQQQLPTNPVFQQQQPYYQQPQPQQQPLPTNPVFQQQMYGYTPQPQPIMQQPQYYQQPLPANPVFQQQPYNGYKPYGSAFGVPRQNQMVQPHAQNVGIHMTGSPLDSIKAQAQQYAESTTPQFFANIQNTVKMMPYTPGSPSLNQAQQQPLPTNPVFQQQPGIDPNTGYPQYNPYVSSYTQSYGMDRAAYDQYYNNQLNNELYGNVGEFDVDELFRHAILTDGELLRRRANTPIGYYNNGVYKYDEEARAKYKEYMDEQYRKQIELNIRISKACHKDDGVTDEQIRMMYDPIYRNNRANTPVSCVTEEDMIPEELAKNLKTPIVNKDLTIGQYNRLMQRCNEYVAFGAIHDRFMQETIADYGRDVRKLQAFAKIKESHDKLLGLKPGESVTGWDDFAARSGPLCIEVAKSKSKKYLNKRIRKFDKDNFCTRVDIKTSIDALYNDDVIPLEFKLKNRNGKVLNEIMHGFIFTKEDGIIPMITPPPGADQSMSPEARARMELERIRANKIAASRDKKDEFMAYAAKGRNV